MTRTLLAASVALALAAPPARAAAWSSADNDDVHRLLADVAGIPGCGPDVSGNIVPAAKTALNQIRDAQSTDDVSSAMAAGVLMLDVGDAAARHDCGKLPVTIYDLVINTYVGFLYAGLRERAAIGLAR